jgi:hypothetical protein
MESVIKMGKKQKEVFCRLLVRIRLVDAGIRGENV